MIIDNKGKIFGKLNIIDLLVILVIIISLAAVFYKFGYSKHKDASSANTQITYTVKVKAIRKVAVDALNVGDTIIESTTKKSAGEIIDKKVENAKEYVNKADGTLGKEAEIPDKYDVYLTVKATGLVNDDGYFLDGTYQLNTFSSFTFNTREIETTGSITQIK